ncbi:MAG: hypothetical protein IJ335_01715 [Lachnospiraceae bacterium]|nr:hypothetical protein [Lachnospiraceae bacterium]
MFWKKNALSYVFWLLYTLVWGSMVVFLSFNHIMSLPVLESLGVPIRLGVALLPVAILPVICVLVRSYVVHHYIHEEYEQGFWKIAEALGLVVIMGIGIWLRYDGIWVKDIQVGGYMQAMVTEGGTISYQAHGASFLYLQLLRGVFLLFGNKPVLALWLQVILFYIAGLFLYLGIKRVVGKLPAMGLFAFFLLTPFFQGLSMELSPLGLYLAIYGFCLFYLTEVLGDIQGKTLQYFFGGIQVAACIYLDFIGITLVIWAVLLVFMHDQQSPRVTKRYFCLLTFGLGLLSAGVLLFVTDMLLTQRSIFTVLQNWWLQYGPDKVTFSWEYFAGTPGLWQIVIPIMGLLGMVSFGFRKKTDRFSPMVLLLTVFVLMGCFGMSSDEMSYDCWIVMQILLVALVGFFDIFDLTDEAYVQEDESEACFYDEQENIVIEATAEKQPTLDVVELPAPKAVKLLENPLPVPQKRARRTMDYPISDIPEDDDFDVQIPEDDDFDYKF